MNVLILASGSPRRSELLSSLGIPFKVRKSQVNETLSNPDISPSYASVELSSRKAMDVAKSFPKHYVLGADTIVAYHGKLLGKPKDEAEAFSVLNQLSGGTHHVYTGVTIVKEGIPYSFFEETEVTFWPLASEEIQSYIDTGEPYDKAGAYGIQGKGAYFVKGIKGDFYNVMGLPIAKTVRFLQSVGFTKSQF